MGWANCGTDSNGRPIGYAHPARCDHPGCKAKIDRGLAHACGGMHGTTTQCGDDAIAQESCELYFCGDHMYSAHVPREVDDDEPWIGTLCAKCTREHIEAIAEDAGIQLSDETVAWLDKITAPKAKPARKKRSA